MLHLLLLILKILGILLLVILGIILAVLLLVLFVPLRYKADVEFDGKPRGNVLVSWLLRLITVRVSYDEGIKALGVDSILVGHEHANSASAVYDGIRFQYGQKTGTYEALIRALEMACWGVKG